MVTKSYLAGTHRALRPADTLANLTPLLDDFGITRIANVTGLDRIGIPVVMVVRPNSRSVAVSQGKGLDLDSAKASGVMEAIETWHAERMTHPLKLASYNDLHQDHKISDVERIPAIEDGQFHKDLPLLWVEGQDLFTSESSWVPYEMVHANYTLPRPTGHGCFPASTNGLASGNCHLEATNHAICEVIERDSTTLWHHLAPDQRAARRVRLDTVDDPDCTHILAILRKTGLDVAIWDTTSDVGVPSFYGLLMDPEAESGHMGAGAGCHPAKHIALSRTLTEAVQTRTTYIAGSRDDLTPQEFSAKGRKEKYDYAARMLAEGDEVADFQAIPTALANSFEKDLDFLLSQLNGASVDEVVAVDLHKQQQGISVVRVVIPGLEAPHDDDNYLPGPRALGVERAEAA
ncbi:MAG: YcaO-like family protein [Alphaproteobacteria bacterium]|nr:YcaO-like family protein [Alphaproteobacteria bacterium]